MAAWGDHSVCGTAGRIADRMNVRLSPYGKACPSRGRANVIFNTKLRFPNIFKEDNWYDLRGTGGLYCAQIICGNAARLHEMLKRCLDSDSFRIARNALPPPSVEL
jgi:hypothetical protein